MTYLRSIGRDTEIRDSKTDAILAVLYPVPRGWMIEIDATGKKHGPFPIKRDALAKAKDLVR